MGGDEQPELTNSQVKKAGDALRHALRETDIAAVSADPSLAWAREIASRFQAAHVEPTIRLVQAAAGVSRSFGMPDPVFRIKRLGRIVEKIARESSGLNRLQDIGGCRIVVPDLDSQREITFALMELAYECREVHDYVAPENQSPFGPSGRGPKGSGYRAIHLIHTVDGRTIETQVRTRVQHGWAVAVERAEQITGYPMKFGEGPGELLDYFRVLSTVHALQETGARVEDDLVADLDAFGEQVLEYYRRTGESP